MSVRGFRHIRNWKQYVPGQKPGAFTDASLCGRKYSAGKGAVRGLRNWNKRNKMNRYEYVVVDIDGDYAHLRRTDIESEELKLVARALLPPEIMEGTKLLYEWMSYSIMD